MSRSHQQDAILRVACVPQGEYLAQPRSPFAEVAMEEPEGAQSRGQTDGVVDFSAVDQPAQRRPDVVVLQLQLLKDRVGVLYRRLDYSLHQ